MGQRHSRRCGNPVCAEAATDCPYICNMCAGRPPVRNVNTVLIVTNCYYIGCRPGKRLCDHTLTHCNNATLCTQCGRYSRQKFVCHRKPPGPSLKGAAKAVAGAMSAAAKAVTGAVSVASVSDNGRVISPSTVVDADDVAEPDAAANEEEVRSNGDAAEEQVRSNGDAAEEQVRSNGDANEDPRAECLRKLISAVCQQLERLEDCSDNMLLTHKCRLKRDYTTIKNESNDLLAKLTRNNKQDHCRVQKRIECLEFKFSFVKDKHDQLLRFYKFSGIKYLQNLRRSWF